MKRLRKQTKDNLKFFKYDYPNEDDLFEDIENILIDLTKDLNKKDNELIDKIIKAMWEELKYLC